MCTVTYIPTEEGYILTHNRDEKPDRSARTLTTENIGVYTLEYPIDVKAKGTWIFTRSDSFTACLLNGAFVNHNKKNKYRTSRGMIMKSLALSDNPISWLHEIDLHQIEPFTMILIYNNQLVELKWDEVHKYIRTLNKNEIHFWNSSTLYDPVITIKRKKLFTDWIAGLQPDERTPERITHFHTTGDLGDPENNLVMIRPGGTQTISITQIVVTGQGIMMKYMDLLAI